MTAKIRQAFVAVAFSGVVAMGIAGATLSGETSEIGFGDRCESAHWPTIPAACLTGAPEHPVRMVATTTARASGAPGTMTSAMDERFAVAFDQAARSPRGL